ncbi:flagellar biosynthetic protein FliO [Bacillus carboniphilus]|uniref:Flagellar biosynthetic protein FliO n=1 Tax=Bacillus carboniphilus TaxID=86663 RepID=A0ABY9JXK6_9BACI|nr:flagellar biosynthetic protein FliO [Bacillus carboniphilus]WLR43529.1 flagellar biosynthetic protein FliO [Bacillus carboniphilus]
MSRKFLLTIMLVILLIPSLAVSAGSVEDSLKNKNKEEQPVLEDDDTKPPDSISIWDFVKMIAALFFVLLILYFFIRLLNFRSLNNRSLRNVENLGGTPLGNNRSVQLIKVGDRVLVVGVGESIQLLKEIEDEREVELLKKEYEEKMSSPIKVAPIEAIFKKKRKKEPFTFKEELLKALGKKSNHKDSQEEKGMQRDE